MTKLSQTGLARAFAALAAALAVASGAFAQERIALVIGNSEYEQTGWRLENPARDARLIADSLSRTGFSVDLVLDADRDMMTDAVRRFGRALREAGEDAVGFFYFAGHGSQSQGLNYLLPIDLDAQVEADIWAQAPRAGLVTDYMATAGNAVNFMVLDACRDNPLPSAARSAGGGGLASIGRARGVLYAYATGPGMTASDGQGDNGPYAEALAAYLTKPGVPAELMFKRVAERVEETTGFAQQPFYESGLRGDEFYFIPPGAAAASPVVEAPAPAPTPIVAGSISTVGGSTPAGSADTPDAAIDHAAFGERALAAWKDRSLSSQPVVARAEATDFVFFGPEQTELEAGLEPRLDLMASRVLARLETNPDMYVQVFGAMNREENRLTIAGKRGVALRQALLDRGVPVERMRGASSSYGKHKPLEDASVLDLNRYAWAQLYLPRERTP